MRAIFLQHESFPHYLAHYYTPIHPSIHLLFTPRTPVNFQGNYYTKTPLPMPSKKITKLQNLPPLSFLSPFRPLNIPHTTSTPHKHTHNPAPDTFYAVQTNPEHDVHETHAYNSYKKPSIWILNPHLPASGLRLVY